MDKSFYVNCPKCGAEMQSVAYQGLTVECCPNCNGMFFDYSEVNDPASSGFVSHSEPRKDAAELDTRKINCPKCGIGMKKRRLISKLGLLLDICPTCKGIWFDQNELAQYRKPVRACFGKPRKLHVSLYCLGCNIETKYDPGRTDPFVCPLCGESMSFVAKGEVYYTFTDSDLKKPALSLLISSVLLTLIYVFSLKVFNNGVYALILTGTAGAIATFLIVRAVVYGQYSPDRVGMPNCRSILKDFEDFDV